MGPTGVESARDIRVELDLKGEEDSVRDEKGEELCREAEPSEKGGEARIKKMHVGLRQCQLPGYNTSLRYTTCYYLVMTTRVHRLSVLFFPTACRSREAGIQGTGLTGPRTG